MKVDSSLPKYVAIRETGIALVARPRCAAISRARDRALCRLPVARSFRRRPKSAATVAAIFASRLMSGAEPLVFEDGKQTRDFIDVRDITRACALALAGLNQEA